MRVIIFLFGLFFIFGLSGCKKWQHEYPEDGVRTKVSPMNRITNKWWTLTKVTVNNVDYTDSVKDKIGTFKMYLNTNSESFAGYTFYYGIGQSTLEPQIPILWNFQDNECKVSMERQNWNMPFFTYTVLYMYAENSTYTVAKLSENELKISLVFPNGTTWTNYFTN